MSATMQIELDADATQELRQLADILHLTPEQTSQRAVEDGLRTLRRHAFFLQSMNSVTAEEGLAILSRAGKNNPPDPGDEMPEDLKYLLDKRER